MGPWGPKMGVPPKKAPILRKMPFQYCVGFVLYLFLIPAKPTFRPHDDVVVVV